MRLNMNLKHQPNSPLSAIFKYAQKVKEDDLEWFDNFAESKLWGKMFTPTIHIFAKKNCCLQEGKGM